MATLFSGTPQNVWIDWDSLLSAGSSCDETCIVQEALLPLMVYHVPVELENAYCTLPQCMIVSSGHITIRGTITSTGNTTVVARSDVTIGSINIDKNAGALIISSQGTVRILHSDIQSGTTVLQALPAEPVIPKLLAKDFTSSLTIIQGIRTVRTIY
jgi:hypothetical protein